MFLNQVTDVILGADLPVNLKLEVAEDLVKLLLAGLLDVELILDIF
jgi:hypothetical protein